MTPNDLIHALKTATPEQREEIGELIYDALPCDEQEEVEYISRCEPIFPIRVPGKLIIGIQSLLMLAIIACSIAEAQYGATFEGLPAMFATFSIGVAVMNVVAYLGGFIE